MIASGHNQWTHNLSRAYTRRPYSVQGVLWTPYVHSIYVFCPLKAQWKMSNFLKVFGESFSKPLRKNQSFPLKISSKNVSKSTISCRFGHIYWRNPQWKSLIFAQKSLWTQTDFGDFRARSCRSSRSQMFFRIGVQKNFAHFTGKHLCRSLFLIKLQTLACKIHPSKHYRKLKNFPIWATLDYIWLVFLLTWNSYRNMWIVGLIFNLKIEV